jgi:hypothetical protein
MRHGLVRKVVDELMGRQVRYSVYYSRTSHQTPNRKWLYQWEERKLRVPQVGWVVGLRWLQTGYRVPPSWDEQAFLKETGPRTPCLLVTGWPTRKPVKVPVDAVELLEEPERVYQVDAGERALMASVARRTPRNEKGQFTDGKLLTVEEMRDRERKGAVVTFGEPSSAVDAQRGRPNEH